jgi:hypothetical protein
MSKKSKLLQRVNISLKDSNINRDNPARMLTGYRIKAQDSISGINSDFSFRHCEWYVKPTAERWLVPFILHGL